VFLPIGEVIRTECDVSFTNRSKGGSSWQNSRAVCSPSTVSPGFEVLPLARRLLNEKLDLNVTIVNFSALGLQGNLAAC
jgi:hypothetical protein